VLTIIRLEAFPLPSTKSVEEVSTQEIGWAHGIQQEGGSFTRNLAGQEVAASVWLGVLRVVCLWREHFLGLDGRPLTRPRDHRGFLKFGGKSGEIPVGIHIFLHNLFG